MILEYQSGYAGPSSVAVTELFLTLHGFVCVQQEGTLTPKEAGVGFLTLTGWSAVLGIMALIAVSIFGAVYGYWKYKGYDKMTTYTRVQKGEPGPST